MSTGTTVPPPVSWAQRNDLLYVVINVECKDTDFKFTEDSMHFKGVSVLDNNKTYEVTLNFLHKINADKVTSKNISRCLEFTIPKAEFGPYWSTLTNDKKKPHFLKVDFNKWVDETSDNEGGPPEGADNTDLFSKLMDMRGDGDGKPSFDDFDDDQEDSDDENLPQLSSEQDEEEEEKKK